MGIGFLSTLEPETRMSLRGLLESYLKNDQLQDYLAYPKQAEFHAAGKHYRNRLLSAGNQNGKCLKNNTLLPTPEGLKPIGDIEVGDHVFGSDGRPVRVSEVHPQGMKPMYRVTTRDGASVCTDETHLWRVRSDRNPWALKTTGHMFGRMEHRRLKYGTGEGGYYELPKRPVVDHADRDLPLAPRLLGLILGDGCISREALEFVSADDDLVGDVRRLAAPYGCNVVDYGENSSGKVVGNRSRTYGITSAGTALGSNGIKRIIRQMGLWGCTSHDKFIPDDYKFCSVSQRIELLSGLLDTDGCAEAKGRRIFVAVSERMARDVTGIVRSLGMNASVRLVRRQVDGIDRPIWRVHIHGGGFNLFRLKRKRERELAGWREQKAMRITSITREPEAHCTCIRIANDDGIFLAGEGYIPTHNTYSCGAEFAMHVTGEYPKWWRGRRFSRPIVAWAAGETSDATRDNPQRMLFGLPGHHGTGMIPKRCLTGIFGRSRGAADAYDFYMIRHISGGLSMIRFRNYSQERRAWQGPPVDVIWFDEEPPEELHSEGQARTIGVQGISMMSFTPLKGYSSVVNLYWNDPDPENSGRHHTRMTINDALHLTPAQVKAEIARWPMHERRARIEGEPALGEGLIYPYDEAEIKVEPMRIPDDWLVIGAIDFGGTSARGHPTAAVKLALDPDSDTLYLAKEYRRKLLKPPEHWLTLRFWGENLLWAWPRDGIHEEKTSGNQLIVMYRNEGMKALRLHAHYPERKRRRSGGPASGGTMSSISIERGIIDIQTRMEQDRFKVFSSCPMFFEEMKQYHRVEGKIVKTLDDIMDAVRYGVMMIRFARPSARTVYRRRGEADWQAGL